MGVEDSDRQRELASRLLAFGVVGPGALPDERTAASGPPPSSPAAALPEPPEPLELSAGTRVLQYELIRPLGSGGMARVWLARDTKLGRRVAIKFLHSAERSVSERFLVEARTTAQLNHEHIVVVHEVNEISGVPFLVLELLEGMPFSEIVGKKRVPATRAVELMVPVVRALGRAHQAGIVHRDLKPENIFLTSSGTVKVLDFGIAKVLGRSADDQVTRFQRHDTTPLSERPLTQAGTVVGTMQYMSPEQWGLDEVDHRTDFWAAGIIFHLMLTGRHPVTPLSSERLFEAAMDIANTPSVALLAPETPDALVDAIDRCLKKKKVDRFASAAELLAELEPMLSARAHRERASEINPYPGLVAFHESDADRFFGRSRETAQILKWVRERPLSCVAGPSGAGKSSFVRAGVIPALKSSGERWEAFAIRPGRRPLSALAGLLSPLSRSGTPGVEVTAEHQALVARLAQEPGYLGTLLRSRAQESDTEILLFVDQFEELYTLSPDAEERAAFIRCLSGMADDASAPLRVLMSMRSDFLDRVADDRHFAEELTRGLFFLPPPNRDGLREALTLPIESQGYRFEEESTLEGMLDALEATPGALPLLQFAAGRLWETRDREHQLLTTQSYEAIGGIAGALAVHADHVLQSLGIHEQRLARAIFERLVTPDGTRDVVASSELVKLSKEGGIEAVIDRLVAERLLLIQTPSAAEGAAVEIVHESLIWSWPTLRRWLDEDKEDAAFLAQLRTAAKQWDQRGRPAGLLWRGEAMEEALHWRRLSRQESSGKVHWRRLSRQELSDREKEFLDAIYAMATRTARRRKWLATATIVLLLLIVVATMAALSRIQDAEREATRQMILAGEEAERARAAEHKISEQLEEIRAKEQARLEALKMANQASAEVEMTKESLKLANERLVESLEESRIAMEQAEEEAVRAKEAKDRAEAAAAEAKRERDRLQQRAREAEERAVRAEKARVQVKPVAKVSKPSPKSGTRKK